MHRGGRVIVLRTRDMGWIEQIARMLRRRPKAKTCKASKIFWILLLLASLDLGSLQIPDGE